MTLVVFGSVRSSPGTTTTALAVASCLRDRVVVEGDPDGGVIAARFGLDREPNLASLATAARTGFTSQALSEHTQILPGGLPVVVGLPSPDRAVTLWRSAGNRLAAALASPSGVLAVVDAGRLSPTSPVLPLLASAAMTVLVARPAAEELFPLVHRLDALRDLSSSLCLCLVGDKPYGPAEVSRQIGVDVLGVIANDPRAARALAGASGASARWVRRSALARSARDVASALLEQIGLRDDADLHSPTEVHA